MKFDNQLRYAALMLESYQGDIPLHNWLKGYFREHKQMGSKDRKLLSDLVYSAFRLGMAMKGAPALDRILTGYFLCHQHSSPFLQYIKPEWEAQIALTPSQKLSFLGNPFSITDIFPWKSALSPELDHQAFCASFLVQPDLFLRVRPGMEDSVLQKLTTAGIAFRNAGAGCLALDNATRVEDLLSLNREVVVQDYNSQGVARFFGPSTETDSPQKIWDCCAASGGKSIMAHDLFPRASITVSDIRGSMLVNLRKRFSEAGIQRFHSFTADLAKPGFRPTVRDVDLVIADLPCSGSGTWSRTPESLFFFKEDSLQNFQSLQQRIISSVGPSLKKGGRLVYITCSVFKCENEEMVDFICQRFSLSLEKMAVLKGYDQKADTMFVASFRS